MSAELLVGIGALLAISDEDETAHREKKLQLISIQIANGGMKG